MASPFSVPATVTSIDEASSITGLPAAPISPATDTIPLETAPVVHAIITPSKTKNVKDPVVTGKPQACELVECAPTSFWVSSPITTGKCYSHLSSKFCWPTSTLSTTCLDGNNPPECLYSSTYFPFISKTTISGYWQNTILPVYGTTSRCVPPETQGLPAGQESCFSYCQYTSPLRGDCTWDEWGPETGRKCSTTGWSTISTCVESLGSCLYYDRTANKGEVVTGYHEQTSWHDVAYTDICVPPIAPKSGGCSVFGYQSPQGRGWKSTSTCFLPNHTPSCIYTDNGRCVGLSEAETRGATSTEPQKPSTTRESTKTDAVGSPPSGKGELGCTWRTPKGHPDRRECWNGNVEVTDWEPFKYEPTTCTWVTSYETMIGGRGTTLSIHSTCEPTKTISWRTTTMTFGSSSTSILTKISTRPLTSGKPSATVSVDRGSPDLHIDLADSVVDGALDRANDLCEHPPDRRGDRLIDCRPMPQWSIEQFVNSLEDRLMNSINDRDLLFTQDGYMDQSIYVNETLRNEYIVYNIGYQMVYNMTHNLPLEPSFVVDADTQIDVNERMKEKYPDETGEDEDDDLTQEEAPRYKLICDLKKGESMDAKDADAMIKYLGEYLDKTFPTPTPKPTCIAVKDEPAVDYACDCRLGAKSGHFSTTHKAATKTVDGEKTTSIDICAYTAWPTKSREPPKTTDPPLPVALDTEVKPNIMTCNDPKTAGIFPVQSLAEYAREFYDEVRNAKLSAKPKGDDIEYGGRWDGFKVRKTTLQADDDKSSAKGDGPPLERWLALSIQYLPSACDDDDNKEINFYGKEQIDREDFYNAFVMRSNACNPAPDNAVGLEMWTPGGTYNTKCIQFKLHSLDIPPTSDESVDKHFLNGTMSWNETTTRRVSNGTTIHQLLSGSTLSSQWQSSALVTGPST